jgi:hypothetical protein
MQINQPQQHRGKVTETEKDQYEEAIILSMASKLGQQPYDIRRYL